MINCMEEEYQYQKNPAELAEVIPDTDSLLERELQVESQQLQMEL